ncbi:MAG: ATP-binding protein [Desulfuromonas thiophila]|nr:ATP-binding protein [Desulfuromonas thiophila]
MKIRLSLLVRFMAVIGAVLLVTMLVFVIVNVRLQREITLENSLHDADYLSEAILRSTYYQMLTDDREMLYKMIEEVGAMDGIRRIRLFNKDGVVTFSTDKAELGTVLGLSAEGCSFCHVETGPPLSFATTAARGRTFVDDRGETFLGVTKPIYNEPSCYTGSCHYHPADRELNGILDVQLSLQSRLHQVDVFRNYFIVLTCVLLVLLFLALLLLTKRFIITPVQALLEHQRRLSLGDLDAQAQISASDELGELAQGANEMTRHLRQSQEEIRRWAATLENKVEQRTRQIREMQGSLARSERLAALGKLVAGIAHEINNPLTGILMFSSMAAETPELDPQVREDLQTITRETQRCAGIVRGLLDFGRESIPQKNFCNINGVVDKALALVEHQALFQDIVIYRNYCEELPELEVDPNQLEQVFVNMFINAAQAMSQGGTLTIDTWEEADEVLIRICDSGSGIPRDILERIFDPFFTTKEDQGTGLGLSVSYGIVENHGGRIEVRSTEGEGTCFTISLPKEYQS